MGRAFVLVFLALCVLHAGLTFASFLIWWGIETAGYEAPLIPDWDLSSAEEWLLVVGLAPVFEEAIFRGWLSGRRAALEFAARIAVVEVAVILYESGGPLTLLPLIQIGALGYALYALVRWLRERDSKQEIPAWFEHNYRYLVWGSAIAFGMLHLLNYDDLTGPLDLILVLPQTLGGLVLAYTRTRLGLPAAVAQHALLNAALMATLL